MSEGRPVVVIADPIDAKAVGRLSAGGCQVVDATSGTPALEAALPNAWGLVVRSRTRVTEGLMSRAPNLRIVARAGVGVDNVDLAVASRRSIQVVNAPTAASASVAELTVAFCLLLVRDLVGRIESTRAGTWERSGQGGELANRSVGFVGYGRIAREAARRLTPFGVSLRAYDPYVKRVDDGTLLLSLDELLAQSDIVSLHAALTPENHHLINAERIGRMRRGAYLINVARGPLVEETALLAALTSGQIGGAALDVFEIEPPTNAELLRHPHVIPTPHLGASTREAQARAGSQVVDELLRAVRGEPLQALANPSTGV
ncbi:MAG: hydroxyacid dehydrogenase [Thermoplasmata archaeon]